MKSLSAIKMPICLEFLYYIFLVLFIFDFKKGIMKLNYNKFNTEKKISMMLYGTCKYL
jgi:hypothetical protein